ncbi:hypothetical protein PR202_ga30281 [Eleusine coracana subsp. coracana]|uniref:Disease resistance R13L4/SHOC-2-like LRR domain-containing protein n=1 Tax=Eleusine coracana subsp. coracana TaxID=191504 RepID=A0AAV5DP08_ELECO|nr:hypothetical protein QOZ80_1AG0003190 [Eleusine coracana subsp. coracana]GJN12038.1 hypothetical protein PR202_ga30281 [Eleusine coracana subsp. coracana]
MKVDAGAFPCARACRFLQFATVPSMFSPGTMPLVQRLNFTVRAWDFAGGGGFELDDLCMRHLPSLEEVHVELWSRKEDAATVVKRVKAALRQAAEEHPNHLALRIDKWISPSRSQE